MIILLKAFFDSVTSYSNKRKAAQPRLRAVCFRKLVTPLENSPLRDKVYVFKKKKGFLFVCLGDEVAVMDAPLDQRDDMRK